MLAAASPFFSLPERPLELCCVVHARAPLSWLPAFALCCLQCPYGSTTLGVTGASSIQSCSCGEGLYLDDSLFLCATCPTPLLAFQCPGGITEENESVACKYTSDVSTALHAKGLAESALKGMQVGGSRRDRDERRSRRGRLARAVFAGEGRA
ncbi:gcc2 and gcc3 protein [Cyclospora cayetanensis]|uniref:Gcc2 and gcc3 protein n=1 Tax=Cyclospora cayetanensis TaxID=88456 RepID=A0A1D3D3N5_9EIME|nr:gcc2 and gcc3 protein [Cyclospora cayetanensis]